jgi:hypothetical protein
MDRETTGGRLHAKSATGETEVVKRCAILLAVASESQAHDSEPEHRRELGPRLISLDQAGQQALELGPILPGRDDVGPGLLVVRGGRPASRLEQRAEVGSGNVPLGESVGTPSCGNERMNGMVGNRSLVVHGCTLARDRLLDRVEGRPYPVPPDGSQSRHVPQRPTWARREFFGRERPRGAVSLSASAWPGARRRWRQRRCRGLPRGS